MASKFQQDFTQQSIKKKQKKFDLGSDVDKEEIFTYPYLTDASTIDYIKEHGHIMIIIRGPNSTLKATLSEMIQNKYPAALHCCADHYFSKTFNPPDRTKETLKLSHAYCEKKVKEACMKKTSPIIIQNTHMRKFEFQKYIDFAAEFNYTIMMSITLYKFNVTPEALEAINPDGLNIDYFRNRLRQWQDIPPLFTAWFISPYDSVYLLKLVQTNVPALLSDGRFCRVFNLSDSDEIWNYFDARKILYCLACYSSDKFFMKKYYLSDTVQECYGKCYEIAIVGYLITLTSIMAIVNVTEEMLELLPEERESNEHSLDFKFSSLDLVNNDTYNVTMPFDFEDSKPSQTVLLENQRNEAINFKNCRLVHLAHKRFQRFSIEEVEEEFYTEIKSLTNELQYTELESQIQAYRLGDNKWILKPLQKCRVKTIFTGLYV